MVKGLIMIFREKVMSLQTIKKWSKFDGTDFVRPGHICEGSMDTKNLVIILPINDTLM